MMEVVLNIYDVTNSGNEKTNNTIMQINKIFKDGIGIGGIFHSAVQVYGDEEWSFGFCEHGTGVFSCPSTKNPMYTFRESIKLGETTFTIFKVNQILRELGREWPGYSYDLLSKNCNHFCDVLCERLGVPKLPGWVNRFAHAGDTAVEIAGNTAYRDICCYIYTNYANRRLQSRKLQTCSEPAVILYLVHFPLQFRQAKTEIVTAGKVAYRFLAGVASNNQINSPNSPGNNSNRGSPRLQSAWFKNLMSTGAKPTSSLELENQDEDVTRQRQRQEDHLRSNSRRHDI